MQNNKKDRARLPHLSQWFSIVTAVLGLLASYAGLAGSSLAFADDPAGQKKHALSNSDKFGSFLQTNDPGTLQNQWQAIDNPNRDGWATEAITSDALKKLKAIGNFIENANAMPDQALGCDVSVNFQCTPLLPEKLVTVFDDDIFRVKRKAPKSEKEKGMHFEGREGLKAALLALCESFSGTNDVRTKFKIFRVRLDGHQAITRQYVEIVGARKEGRVEQHATWEAEWNIENQSELAIEKIKLLEFEQIRSSVPDGPLFSDRTASVVGQNECFNNQFQRGYGYWRLGVPYTRYQITEMMGHPGLAIADINGDQLEDLYVCQEQGLPNRLFLQQEDGTAVDVADQWNCDWLQASRSALFVDLDNDGDQDLVMSFLGGVAIASNQGDRFEVLSVIPTGDDMLALAAADFDHDGDVDIYATAYYANKILSDRQASGLPASGNAFVYHDANVGGANHLLRNDIINDDWLFTDVTEAVGLDTNNTRFSFAAAWEDYDNDGDQDLYVANDYGRDNLYENDNGRFRDIAASVGAEDAASGMSVSWSDYNHDGRMDVYISNMWSAAGNRIAFQPDFKKNASPEVKERLQRFARGNTLLKNNSELHLEDVSKKAGVEMGRWAWGSKFADINNDGWDDILIANGFITKSADNGDL